MKNSNKTFLLIHGAWEGAWSWEQTTKYLEQYGHNITTIDLSGHGDDKTPVSEITMLYMPIELRRNWKVSMDR